MANVNRPFGFTPVGSLLGAGGFNSQGRLYNIPNDATNSYAIGDVVMSLAGADADGVPKVQKWGGAATTSALPLGIIVGIRQVDPGVSLVAGNLDPTKTYIPVSSGSRYVYVVDDPFVIFEAQFDATGCTQALLHANSSATVTANQSTLSNSSQLSSMVLASAAVTATLPIRLLGAVQKPDNAVTTAASPYVRALCKWNYHEFGVTAGASGTIVGYLAA